MTGVELLARRLASLEMVVADLQQRLNAAPVQGNWLEKVIGSISDESAFLEALEHARIQRQSDRPPIEPGEQP